MKYAYLSISLLFTAGSLSSQDAPPPADEPYLVFEDLIVQSVTRVEKLPATLPQTITVVPQESYEDQLALANDPIRALSFLLPTYSPSRDKMTGNGETFRGRSPLFMIDGIPQSTPLRDGSRDGHFIDAAAISTIEVVHGASAAQGMGATGGIINYVTIRPPVADGLEQRLELGLNSSTTFDEDGYGYRSAYNLGWREAKVGFIGSMAYEWRGMQYDGDGELVGLDNVQGDTMGSATINLFGKLRYDLTPAQHVEVMVNNFNMAQDREYVSVNGNAALGIPVRSVEPTPSNPIEGEDAENALTSLSLTYEHRELLGGLLNVNLFAQRFDATFGGGRFNDFVYNGEIIFEQSENQSEKRGAKITYARTIIEGDFYTLSFVSGADYIQDQTQQELIQTGRLWVPETTYKGVAPYLQVDQAIGPVLLSAGVRYEQAKLEVDDFRTLEFYGAPLVQGGSPDFDEWLYNVGITYNITDMVNVYGSYAQGFGMPDVGRVLRGINTEGEDIDDYLNLQPIVTDNYELGLRVHTHSTRVGIAAFVSTAELGSLLVRDPATDVFSVRREATEIYGLELSVEQRIWERTRVGGSLGFVEGKSDTNGNGVVDTELSGREIPARKLTLFWTQQWLDSFQTRLQSQTLFDDDGRQFDGYHLVDLLGSYRTRIGLFQLGIQNVFDEYYITYFSQVDRGNSRYFSGRGRTVSLLYRTDF